MKQINFKNLFNSFCIGVSISIFIAILFSLKENTGFYHPTPPDLTTRFGNQLNAMLIQTISSGFYGILWFLLGKIYKLPNISLSKATILHFILGLLISLPVAYFLNWTNLSYLALLSFILMFTIIYCFIWAYMHILHKAKIKTINEKLKQFNSQKNNKAEI